MPLPIQAVQAFLQRNPAYLQGRDPQQVMAMLVAGNALPTETPPVTVSPGSPAPVQPGVQIDAPAPVADYRNQEALRQNMTDPQELARRVRESVFGEMKQARDSAEIPPEIAEVLRRREARAEGDLEASEKERKQAMWLAVAMAGAKMASSQSPYFMAALAEGLDAGLQGFSKAKAEAAERKASILDRQEQAVLDRYQALQSERDRAVAMFQAGEKMTKDQIDLINSGEDQLMARAEHDLNMRTGRAKAEEAEFKVRTQGEAWELDKAESRARIAASNRSGRGGGGGGGSDGEREIPRGEYDLFEGAMQRAQRFEDLAGEIGSNPKRAAEKARLLESARQTRASANKRLLQAERRAGYPVGGAATAGPAAARAAAAPRAGGRADFIYDPTGGLTPAK